MKKIKEKLKEHNLNIKFWLGNQISIAIGNLRNNWRGA